MLDFGRPALAAVVGSLRLRDRQSELIVAIFYPFSQFCEINVSLLSLQKQPNTAPNLFQRGVEYGKYALAAVVGSLRLRDRQSELLGLWPQLSLYKIAQLYVC